MELDNRKKKHFGRNRIIQAGLAAVLSLAMILTMTPLSAVKVFAASAGANGGTVESNSEDDARDAFGSSNVTAEYDSQTLTITLNSDIDLEAPVAFVRGSSGDRIILDLNGHAITGAAGQSGTDQNNAKGGNAIEIASADFDVEIRGPGSVTGGRGAVHETEEHNRYGMDGGMAVCLTGYSDGTYWYPNHGVNSGRLDYGLSITGGAALTGGRGADVTAADLLYKIRHFSGNRWNGPSSEAGNGGAGIGQYVNRLSYDAPEIVYTRIEVEDGTVTGGIGGNEDLSSITPTQYAIMNSSEAEIAMQGKTNNQYAEQVGGMMRSSNPGNGGDGIMIGAGRKYVYVAAPGTVRGGTNGRTYFGNNKHINNLGAGSSDAGNGISVNAGDIGLTDEPVDWGTYDSKTKDSNDMGIYIAGTVTGGDSSDADALGESAGDAGDGLFMNGDGTFYGINGGDRDYEVYPYGENFTSLGVVEVASGGSVNGGSGGSAVNGIGGNGGSGINENYDYETDGPRTIAEYGTNYYIINGSVNGGDGGDSLSLGNIVLGGMSGSGGNGICFTYNYRDHVNVEGAGSVNAGDCGSAVIHDNSSDNSYVPEAVRFYQHYDTNIVNVDAFDGSAAVETSGSKINVTASMTAFNSNPTGQSVLSCTVDKPSGYTGDVYIVWTASIYQFSTYGLDSCRIESANGDYTSFRLLTNSAYKYLAWPTYSDSELNMNNYYADVATADRMSEDHKSRTEIFCCVLLDDGSWGKSNVISFTKNGGWDGGSGGTDPGPSDADQQAADSVQGMINALDPDTVDLSDESFIEYIREEYEALTDIQKSLVDISKLEAAEAKIESLNQEAADNVIGLIENLPASETFAGMSEDEIADTKAAIEQAISAYNALTDRQKDIVDDSGTTSYLNEVKREFDETFPESSTEGDVEPVDRTIKADMVTLAGGSFTYNGKAQKPKVTVKAGDRTLKEGTDYKLVYSNNTNAGTAKVTVSPADGSRYTGTVEKTFKIEPKPITPAVTLNALSFNYTGKVIKPVVKTVKDGKTAIASSQFSVKYKGARKQIGTYSVTVTMKGNYKGSKTVNFTIGPKAAAASKPKAAKKALTAKWKVQKAKMPKKRITGYQVQASTAKNFAGGVKTKNVKGYKKKSVRIGGLKAKTKYYVRVRTYMKAGGRTYYSTWSKVKSVKTK